VDEQECLARWQRWCQVREARAFDDVANYLQPSLVGYAAACAAGDDELACRVVEQALCELWRHQGPPLQLTHLGNWLRQRIRARLVDESRAEQRRRARSLPGDDEIRIPDPSPGPLEQAEENERRNLLARRVSEGIDSLAPERAVVIRMHFLEKRTLTDIANQLGLSVPAICHRRDQGLAQLRHLLSAWGVNPVT
jgi:RNA polymerase sigma factor (sigma-70 family)